MTTELADDLAAVARIQAVPRILEVICRSTGMGFSAVARVTEKRWIACAVRDEIAFGLQPGGELQVETTICDEIRDSGQLVVIDHVAEDAAFCQHPTPKMYGFQSYISVPIYRADGSFFGTLCAIDPRPARLTASGAVEMFKLLAELIAFHLDAQERLAGSEIALLEERKTAELREQFIGVLGHDLRNPLAAIDASATALLQQPLDPSAKPVVARIKRSAARMSGLIANILDFSHGRQGGGLPVTRVVATDLVPALQHVVAELQAAWPGRVILSDFALSRPVLCDRARISQLLSNLLANALTHGAPTGAIRVQARSDETGFELSVANPGEPIPPAAIDRLFLPFSRAAAHAGQPGQQHLGLGLYISAEIARAHHGTLEVASSPAETRFTFRLPTPRP